MTVAARRLTHRAAFCSRSLDTVLGTAAAFLAAAAFAVCGCGGEVGSPSTATDELHRAARVATTLFINFDGATIQQAATSDAARDQSEVCAAVVPPFDHRAFGEDRQAVSDSVLAQAAAYFADFALELTAVRPPPDRPYHMVVLGGTPALCGRGDGIGGLAPLDCDNASGTDVAFVFSEPITAIAGIALVIAHEAGHTFGLVHTTEPCDVMSNLICPSWDKRFLDQEMAVAPDHLGRCGLEQVNSYQLLSSVLGPPLAPPTSDDAGSQPGDAAPGTDLGADDTVISDSAVAGHEGGGCALAGRFSTSSRPLFLLFCGLLAVRRSRRRSGMGILDDLSSATGNKSSNIEVAKRCIQTPALLHTIAEGLRTGSAKARVDCTTIMCDVARRRPELLAGFVSDFLDASRDFQHKGGSKKISRLAFEGLALVAPVQPGEVFAARDYLQEVARSGGPLGIEATAVLAVLCRDNANYRGKLLGALLRLLPGIAIDDLPRWLAAVGPAVEGSMDSLRRLEGALEGRREALSDAAKMKVDRLLVKLERTTIRPKARK